MAGLGFAFPFSVMEHSALTIPVCLEFLAELGGRGVTSVEPLKMVDILLHADFLLVGDHVMLGVNGMWANYSKCF